MTLIKFGLYEGISPNVRQEFEGEYLAVHGDLVSVVRNDGSGSIVSVAVVKLDKDQCIKPIK